MLTQRDKIDVELRKKIITEKKTTFSSLKNQNRKNVNGETKKVNKLLSNILTDNITELNKLIYTRAKLVGDKVDIPQRNKNRN